MLPGKTAIETERIGRLVGYLSHESIAPNSVQNSMSKIDFLKILVSVVTCKNISKNNSMKRQSTKTVVKCSSKMFQLKMFAKTPMKSASKIERLEMLVKLSEPQRRTKHRQKTTIHI